MVTASEGARWEINDILVWDAWGVDALDTADADENPEWRAVFALKSTARRPENARVCSWNLRE